MQMVLGLFFVKLFAISIPRSRSENGAGCEFLKLLWASIP